MDFLILKTCALSTLAFLIMNLLLLRIINLKNPIQTTQAAYLLALSANIAIAYPYGIEIVIASSLLYSLIVLTYRLRIFGIWGGSLHLRVLALINKSSRQDTLNKIDDENILKEGLKRLVDSKTILYDGQYYSLNRKNIPYNLFHNVEKYLIGLTQSSHDQ